MDTLKIIVGVIIAVFVIRYIIKKYNTLSFYREPVRKTLADIDTYKAQRQSTLRLLYEITEQFSRQESNIHMQTTLANMSRSRASFQALAAAYPDLKSNQTYLSLMHSVETLEHNIQNSRKLYNEAVSNYQTVRSQIPYCFFALLFGFKATEYNPEKDSDVTLSIETAPPYFHRLNRQLLVKVLCQLNIIALTVTLNYSRRLVNSERIGVVKTKNATQTLQTKIINLLLFLVQIVTTGIFTNGNLAVKNTGHAVIIRTVK